MPTTQTRIFGVHQLKSVHQHCNFHCRRLVFENRKFLPSGKPEERIKYFSFKLFNSPKFYSSSGSGNSGNDKDKDLMMKWNKMYEENAPPFQIYTPSSLPKSEVRIVTFDLDNTIWKTGNVISTANDVLANYLLQDLGLHVPIRVEKVMGQLFQTDKGKYSPILVEEALKGNDARNQNLLEKIKSPTKLTQLRVDALKEVFRNQTSTIYNEDEINTLSQNAFDIWTKARHDAIPNNLASSVIECLSQVKSLQTSYGKNIVVGAITDGNSDPRNVDMLKDYFDFCINAESVGISKPDRRVYDAALKHVYLSQDLQHIFYDVENDSDDDIDCDALFEKIRNKWIHVGDDFVKDIVGSSELKMRTVWSRELVMDKLQQQSNEQAATKQSNDDTTNREERENLLMKKISEEKIVKMTIGSEDFLADSIQSEFADAIVDEFLDVGRILQEWHEEGLASLNRENYLENSESTEQVKDIPLAPDQEKQDGDMKFCVECGTKLPFQAKFCSSCGSKQP